MSAPRLEWVLFNGEIHHVSEYSHGLRPKTFCPICGQEVILKLGSERVHHAAHYEGAICKATQPETVTHINSKYHLKKVLSNVNELAILQPCSGWKYGTYAHACNNKKETLYVQGWDRVEDEWQFGKYRLDLALLKGDAVIGAIEILVSHPTEPDKLSFLDQQEVAWLEIKVDDSFYSEPTAWKGNTALSPEKYNQSNTQAWQCKECAASYQSYLDAIQKREKLEKERQLKKEFASQFEVVYTRVVDFFYPSGKKYRSIYIVQNRKSEGKVVCADLQEIGSQRRTLATEYPPITDDSYRRLWNILEDELKKKSTGSTIVDGAFPWKKDGRFHPKKFIDESKYPYNYELMDGKWKKKSAPPNGRYLSDKRITQNRETKETDTGYGIFQNRNYPCEKCGKITNEWSSSNGVTKTCICWECADKQRKGNQS